MQVYNRPIQLRQQREGYLYFTDRGHPLAVGNSGKVYLHRHVVSLAIGRWITSEEVVHHVDGDKKNNSPNNLIILTNIDHSKLHKGERKIYKCQVCNKKFKALNIRHRFCSQKCRNVGMNKVNISKKMLSRLVWEVPTKVFCKWFGVSDTAIAKRCIKLGITKPGRGYWAKRRSASIKVKE